MIPQLKWLDIWQAEEFAKVILPTFKYKIDYNLKENNKDKRDAEWDYDIDRANISPECIMRNSRYICPLSGGGEIYPEIDFLRWAEVFVHEAIHGRGWAHNNTDYFTTYKTGKRAKRKLHLCYHSHDLLSHWIVEYLLYGKIPPSDMVTLKRRMRKLGVG